MTINTPRMPAASYTTSYCSTTGTSSPLRTSKMKPPTSRSVGSSSHASMRPRSPRSVAS